MKIKSLLSPEMWTLITGAKLVHVWEQGTCPEQDIHEITILPLSSVCSICFTASRFFRNKTGRTPKRYLIDYRLGIAARLLLTTKLSVAEIGYSSGFNTLCHFNRLFRESKGCTPSEFRERF